MNHNLRNFLLLLLALCGGPILVRGQQNRPTAYNFDGYWGNIVSSDSIKVRPIDTTQALTVQARYTNVGPVLPGNLQPTLTRSKLRVYVQWLTGTVNLPQTLWYELKSGTQTIVSGTVSVNYNGVSIPGIPGVALTGINSQLGSLADSYALLSSTKLNITAFTSYSAGVATTLSAITSQLASSTATSSAIAASVASFSATYLSNRTADLAALSNHTSNTSNPHGTTKAQVGLGSVDNTPDSGKPVSTLQQAALDLKANQATTYNKTETDGRYRRFSVGLDYNTDITTGKPTIPSVAADVGALSALAIVTNVTALNAAATGTPKLIVCLSDPDFSTDPTINLWDGTNLTVFLTQKRN